MIQEGAKLVVEVADVLEEIGGQLNAAASRGRPSARKHWKKVPPRRSGEQQPQLPLEASPPALSAELAPGGAGASPAGAGASPAGGASPGGAAVRSALSRQVPLHVDEIAARCGLPAGVALAQLLELELSGVVEQLGGKRFRLATRPDRNRHRLAESDRHEGN